ncbi:MAG: ABC transporter ATP-binding protein [Gammaproteobacteria bacterium]|nr:ABC transporter ATP-binding protein [Gammaproteobacteria bacterium]
MSPTAVEFTQASKQYGRFVAVDGLDLTIHQGEVIGLLGHNGAGKTTSMKMLLGVTSPTSGTVRVFGEDPSGQQAHTLRQKLGYLPESVSFYEQLTGLEVLRYFARLKRVDTRGCEALLEQVGLKEEAIQKRVKTYSKGMRQRLGLAQALLGEPRLLLLDEPTVGLDPLATRDLYAMLDQLRKQGVTIILSSHVLPGIERHIDRAAIMGQGRLLAVGSLEALREHAELPLLIQVRGGNAREQADALDSLGVTCTPVQENQLEVKGSASTKMEVLRRLMQQPGVEDIDVLPPSLETLYAHISLQGARP